MIRRKGNHMIKIIILIAMLFSPMLANAQNLFEPIASDLSIKVLSSLFGQLLMGMGQDPMLNAIKYFNSAILVIGGLLAAYTILAGTVGTAHDGEMLGKKFSSVWIPIRYSLGTALVLPVIGGGYCVMQAIVMWLVVNGIGLADIVYVSYMSNPVTNQNIKVPALGDNGTLTLAENIFAMNVCVIGNNKILDDSMFRNWFGNKTVYSTTTRENQVFYGSNEAPATFNNCGTITYPISKPMVIEQQGQTTNQGVLGSLGQLYQTVDMSPLIEAHKTETIKLQASIQALAQQAVNNYDSIDAPAIYTQINQASNEYKKNIEAIGKQFTSNVNLTESALRNGWLVAGFNFLSDININNNLASSITSVSQSNANMFSEKVLGWQKDSTKYLSVISSVLSQSKNSQVTLTLQKDNPVIETGASIWGKLGASIGETFTGINLYELQNDNRNPLIVINEMGQRLISANTTMMGISSGIALIAGTASFIASGGVIAAFNVFMQFMSLPIGFIWVIGIFASYFLPLMPSMIWVGCIIGYILLVIEAVIAAPLWAVMHLHPNGDDLTGKGGAGYMLVLSLMFRPVLLIFGFIASMIVLAVVGELINKVFFQLFALVNGGTIQGISAMFVVMGATGAYCVLMFITIKKVFSIITLLPDQILRWIGGTQETMGAFAGEFENSMTSAGKATGATLGGMIASSKSGLSHAGNSAQQLSNSLKAGKDKDKGDTSALGGNDTPPSGGGSGGSSIANAPMNLSTARDTTAQQEAPQRSNAPKSSFASQMNQLNTSSQPSKGTVEGKVVGYGKAPYKNDPLNKESFFIQTENQGKTQTTWGKGLENMIAQNSIEKGDFINFSKQGSKAVETTDNQNQPISAERNEWALNELNNTKINDIEKGTMSNNEAVEQPLKKEEVEFKPLTPNNKN